jgi:methylglutaconyl-CoA hydratase
MKYELITTRREGPVEYLTLNRPDVRNAFNEEFGQELTRWAEAIAADEDIRVVVMDGAGKVFCAGADLTWMAKMASYTQEDNVRDATAMAHLFSLLDRLPVPLIGRIHGAALGGGAGPGGGVRHRGRGRTGSLRIYRSEAGHPALDHLAVRPHQDWRLGREGIVPHGMRFDAARAREIGLVHAVVPLAGLDARVAQYVQEVLSAAPEAVATAKELVRKVWGRPAQDTIGLTSDTIAARRASEEGQEGMRAFLEKRKATWNVSVPPRPDR